MFSWGWIFMWRKFFIVVMLVMILGGSVWGAAYPVVYFEMEDPVGDDYGYGSYQYPTNIAFQPYKGLFDIIGFKVWAEKEGVIYFDTRFATITNPWMAPEGFIHQNLRIYIDTSPKGGCVAPVKRGPNVVFNPKFGWEVCLKVVGWNNSQLITLEDGVLKIRTLQTEVLGDGQTIRVSVPIERIGVPDKRWNYYVFVGSYDGFGEDFFRKVAVKPGAWVIGGGTGDGFEPRVMDILAPKHGKYRQEAQLKSFNIATKKLAELYPVGPGNQRWSWVSGLGFLAVAALAGAAGYGLYRKPKGLSWFWVKTVKNGKTSV